MSNTETPKNVHESIENPQNSLNDLNENSKKELLEWLKEEKIPLADIIKEVKAHWTVSYLYNSHETILDFGWEHTKMDEKLWFIYKGKCDMPRWLAFNYLTFKKEWNWMHIYLNEVRWSSAEWYAHVKTLKLNEFVEFIHKHS